MYEILQHDRAGIASLLEKAKMEGLAFLQHIDTVPTSATYAGEKPRDLGDSGLGAQAVLEEFKERFRPVMVASGGPRYWGFVTGGATPAAILGDWLATIYDQNTQTVKGQGDISAIIEFEAIRLLLQLFDLPEDYLGGFVTGATMSNFTCLGVARQWAGRQKGMDISKEGMSRPFPVITSYPHSSVIKSLAMLGMGSNNFIKVPGAGGNREAMDMSALEATIVGLKGQPFILLTSGGTVNTVDFDDFRTIARLKEKYNFWWHIDAAFGAFAALSPGYKHLLAGWENADSITIDCHKWLNVPYENAFFLVKEKHKTLQAETFQNSNAPYLGDPLENFNYLNFLPENSRRLKALPVWFTLLAYGKQGYKAIVENNISLAQALGQFIETSNEFILLAPVRLNTVCFTLKNERAPDKVSLFLETLNQSGKVFLSPTIYNQQQGIRAALVNWQTTAADIKIVRDEMQKALEKIK